MNWKNGHESNRRKRYAEIRPEEKNKMKIIKQNITSPCWTVHTISDALNVINNTIMQSNVQTTDKTLTNNGPSPMYKLYHQLADCLPVVAWALISSVEGQFHNKEPLGKTSNLYLFFHFCSSFYSDMASCRVTANVIIIHLQLLFLGMKDQTSYRVTVPKLRLNCRQRLLPMWST